LLVKAVSVMINGAVFVEIATQLVEAMSGMI
jgi:hypothetical protein